MPEAFGPHMGLLEDRGGLWAEAIVKGYHEAGSWKWSMSGASSAGGKYGSIARLIGKRGKLWDLGGVGYVRRADPYDFAVCIELV